ncbi:SMI1/KNR4 family protein [Lacinutrix undariae]
MKNKLEFDDIEGINSEDFKQIEEQTGFTLPTNLKLFLEAYSGGNSYGKDQVYTYDLIHDDGWKSVNSIAEILNPNNIIESYLNLKPHLQDTFKHFELTSDHVEIDYLLPVMGLEDGGLIYISIGGKHNGKVYEVDNGDFGILFKSNSLEDFIYSLYIYDFEKDEYIKE